MEYTQGDQVWVGTDNTGVTHNAPGEFRRSLFSGTTTLYEVRVAGWADCWFHPAHVFFDEGRSASDGVTKLEALANC